MNNLKKTLALVAALAMTATAFVGCGGKDESSTSEPATEATTEAAADESSEAPADESSEAPADESSEAPAEEASIPALGTPDGTLADGGDALTILCWTEDDLKFMYDVVADASGMDKSKMVYKNVGSAGGEANEKYAQVFASDEDVDLYFCDADWNKAYQNNDEYSAPLAAVGISEDMYANAYGYTVAMGKDNNGVLKGATWQVAAGGYAYRTDLAEEYLGIKTPEDMQAAISDWDAFWATAATVYEKSGGATAMADSVDGVWRAYSNGNRTSAWVQDGTITADNAKACLGDFINMAKTNYDAGYISTASQWTDDWLPQGMSEGTQANKTMGFFFPTWSLGAGSQLSQAEGEEGKDGSTYGMFNIVAGPTSWFWGGTWICVSPKCDNATEAGQFIYYMTADTASMQAYVDAKGDFVNNKIVMANTVAAGTNSNPLLGGQDQLAVLADAAAGIDMSIATEYDATINTTLQSAIKKYCEGTLASEEDCVNEFLDKLSESLTDVTVE
ncbi:MAG: ABC transporter substrate-binding protein [Ruminococcus sp.]|nr:ABC transporter substrate-binding protein [Ruminococcus sp.]